MYPAVIYIDIDMFNILHFNLPYVHFLLEKNHKCIFILHGLNQLLKCSIYHIQAGHIKPHKCINLSCLFTMHIFTVMQMSPKYWETLHLHFFHRKTGKNAIFFFQVLKYFIISEPRSTHKVGFYNV
jgi:hypothetical protein